LVHEFVVVFLGAEVVDLGVDELVLDGLGELEEDELDGLGLGEMLPGEDGLGEGWFTYVDFSGVEDLGDVVLVGEVPEPVPVLGVVG
jgi:hypothetical protein